MITALHHISKNNNIIIIIIVVAKMDDYQFVTAVYLAYKHL